MFNAVRGAFLGALALVGTGSLLLIPLFLLWGPDRILVGPVLESNTLWVGVAMVFSLIAATVGGWIAHRASGALPAVYALAALVLVFGLADAAIHHWLVPEISRFREDLSWGALLVGLREPLWYDLSGPVLMAVFVWVAGICRHTEMTPDVQQKGRSG